MKLLFELPEKLKKHIGSDEQIKYCAPFDIGADGRAVYDGFVAVTENRIIVFQGDGQPSVYPFDEIDGVKYILTDFRNGVAHYKAINREK